MENYTSSKDVSPKKSSIDIRAKPKRPLSAYNIFYRISRKFLISSISKKEDASTFLSFVFNSISSMERTILLESALEITKEYRSEKVGKETRINKMKPLGVLGFKDLTCVIAAQWAKLPQSTKQIFESCSLKDKNIYGGLRTEWVSEKDAEIRKKLDEQSLCGDSIVTSTQNQENLRKQSQSRLSSELTKTGQTYYYNMSPLCSTSPPIPLGNALSRFIGNSEFSSYGKSLQNHCFKQSTFQRSYMPFLKGTEQREAVINNRYHSLNPNFAPVFPDQVLSTQDQILSSRNRAPF
jgi:hypothetical protein